jgi:hypothetical protein
MLLTRAATNSGHQPCRSHCFSARFRARRYVDQRRSVAAKRSIRKGLKISNMTPAARLYPAVPGQSPVSWRPTPRPGSPSGCGCRGTATVAALPFRCAGSTPAAISLRPIATINARLARSSAPNTSRNASCTRPTSRATTLQLASCRRPAHNRDRRDIKLHSLLASAQPPATSCLGAFWMPACLRLPAIFPTPSYFGGGRPAELAQSSK